ncbi:MAG: LAGLIDADG family homing endonuclease [Halobacteriaceae archaeon]
MAHAENTDLVERFEQFYRRYYADEVAALAQNYPRDQRSLYVDFEDLETFDPDLADDVRNKPAQFVEHAEEALRRYDLPVDVDLEHAHVRIRGLRQSTDIRELRSRHVNQLVALSGIVRKSTEVRPKVQVAAFECQRCGTMTRIKQSGGSFRDPHECAGCERQGPFQISFDESEFVDSQQLRIQERPEGLRGGETPESIDVQIEDDVCGRATPGDYVTVTGILHLDQSGDDRDRSPVFDVYMEGLSLEIEDEEFEEMDISDEDRETILELSQSETIYDDIVDSIAPSIYGFELTKLAMALQLFSGVTKHLPDGSRTRGDLHILLIGDPGTGKCVAGDTRVTLADGTTPEIRELVEENLDDPTPVDDGVYDEVDIPVPSLEDDGTIGHRRATKVWKREAPETMYRVRTSDGRDVTVTPSHPLFVQSGCGFEPTVAEALSAGQVVAVGGDSGVRAQPEGTAELAGDGGVTTAGRAGTDRIVDIEPIEPTDEWVYDLEIEETHNYLSNGIVSHNSQLLQYVQNISPRSVYTSGKGSSSAGLTAAAVRDDFGDGGEWSLEAGALVLADRGIAAVDELDKMRCVTGDTLVHLADGEVAPLQDLATDAAREGEIEELDNGRTIRDVDLSVWTMNDAGELVRRPVSAVHEYEAPQELVEVTLSSGEELTSTADHPFFVREAGRRTERSAANLGAGDWVYVPRSIPQATTDGGVRASSSADSTDHTLGTGSTQPGLSPALAAILGYLSGDGNIYQDGDGRPHGIRFTNAEPELLAHFEDVCREEFDAEPSRPESEVREDGVQTVRLYGRDYAEVVLDAGMTLETYERKSFPRGVTRGSPASKAAFVRALADSEGWVDTTSGNLRIASSSYDLLLGTKSLLLEFGIGSQIHERERADGRDLFNLVVTDADALRAFERRVGFTLDRKQEALENVVEGVGGGRTVLDVIPDVGDRLLTLRTALLLNQGECGLQAGTYCDFENGHANLSFDRATDVLRAFEGRRRAALDDLRRLESEQSWAAIDRLVDAYHISQSELANGSSYSQQSVSRLWGRDEELRSHIQDRITTVLQSVAGTDLDQLEDLVRGDVKWRQVEQVETVAPEASNERVTALEATLGSLLDCSPRAAVQTARDILDDDSTPADWGELRATLDRHEISHSSLARSVGVSQSTVTRWLNETTDGREFEAVRRAANQLITRRRAELDEYLEEIESLQSPRVYDLTVEGTHNFVANGMVVHNSEDQSAMHEALEQQSISVSKAGINATLKSRCSLLGAANPTYGRFDQYEPIGEQIDLAPPLISRFDLIFTVTDQPDAEKDRRLAEHIIQTNYAGELNTHREEMATSNISEAEVQKHVEEVAPAIDAELLQKYVAYARRHCFPTMSDEAMDRIREFYVDLRAEGQDEDAPVPVTARKLEALVRLAEASARIRLSDTVTADDADRVIEIVRSCLRDIGVDPETGNFDADVIETGTSKTQRDRKKSITDLVEEIESEHEEGAPVEEVLDRAEENGIERSKAESELEKLTTRGELYKPSNDHVRTI